MQCYFWFCGRSTSEEESEQEGETVLQRASLHASFMAPPGQREDTEEPLLSNAFYFSEKRKARKSFGESRLTIDRSVHVNIKHSIMPLIGTDSGEFPWKARATSLEGDI